MAKNLTKEQIDRKNKILSMLKSTQDMVENNRWLADEIDASEIVLRLRDIMEEVFPKWNWTILT